MIIEKQRSGFDLKMTAEEINRKPIAAHEGTVHIVRTEAELATAVQALCRETVLGFDTETKPNFAKDDDNPLSLIQLAGSMAAYIFQLRHIPSCAALQRLFSDERIIKAGVNIVYDIERVQECVGGTYKGFVDLSVLAKDAGLKNFSLRGLSAVLLGVRITKGMKLSNWARDTLLPAQIKYAATDAWISRELYLRLQDPDTGLPSLPECKPASDLAGVCN